MWFVTKTRMRFICARRLDDNAVWFWLKLLLCLFTIRTFNWNVLCRLVDRTERQGAQRETASRPTATSSGLTRPPSHDRYNNYRNFHPHHCSLSVPSICNTVHNLFKNLHVFYFNPYSPFSPPHKTVQVTIAYWRNNWSFRGHL
jgi:hypothetical protein